MQTDIIYLDFAKTFDSADHNILLDKPRAYGVSGQFLNWLKIVDGAASQWALVTSPMHQKEWLRLLFTQTTQKYLTALVRKKIAWHYRPPLSNMEH